MIFGRFRRRSSIDATGAIYRVIVAQSRQPSFYTGYSVPDTVDGRFDMVVLHLVLLLRRLARESGRIRRLGQDVFDLFCRDMDHNLREMGVGDLSVPKKMRSFAEAYFGRLEAYDRALRADNSDELAAALARNVMSRSGQPSAGARRLAEYAREISRRFDCADGVQLAGAGLDFPDPDTIPTQA